MSSLTGRNFVADGHPIIDTATPTPHRQRIVRLAFLAPQIQKAILAGTQPRSLTLARLVDGPMPTLWSDQIRMAGMAELSR